MARPVLEIADIFRDHGAAWRKANAGHVSLGQLKVMSAIESCRTAALGGHVMRCEDCSHTAIAYNRFYEASGGARIVSIVGILNQSTEPPGAQAQATPNQASPIETAQAERSEPVSRRP